MVQAYQGIRRVPFQVSVPSCLNGYQEERGEQQSAVAAPTSTDPRDRDFSSLLV